MRGKPEQFADHYSQARLFCRKPDADRAATTSSPRSASSSHACRRKRCASASSRCSPTSPQSWPKASRAGSASRCRRRSRARSRRRFRSEVDASAGVVAVRAARRRARHRAARRVARRRRRARPHRCARCMRRSHKRRRCRASSAPGSAWCSAPTARRSTSRCRWKRRRRSLWDAVVLPDGDAAKVLSGLAQALEFVKDQYRHCKPMLGARQRQRVAARGRREHRIVGRPRRSGPRDRRDVGREHASAGERRRTRRCRASSQHSPSTGTSSANRTRPRCSCAGSKIGRAPAVDPRRGCRAACATLRHVRRHALRAGRRPDVGAGVRRAAAAAALPGARCCRSRATWRSGSSRCRWPDSTARGSSQLSARRLDRGAEAVGHRQPAVLPVPGRRDPARRRAAADDDHRHAAGRDRGDVEPARCAARRPHAVGQARAVAGADRRRHRAA